MVVLLVFLQNSKRQIQLPLSVGGLGIRSSEFHCVAAFVSSLNSVAPSIPSNFQNELDEASKLLPGDDSKILKSKSQKVISDGKSLDDLLARSDIPNKARLRSCGGTQGSAVINAPLGHARGFRLNA